MGHMNWRDKDDLDLTSEDISAMADEGEPVEVVGPPFPASAHIVAAVTSYGAETLNVVPGRAQAAKSFAHV
jgi:hypothetical protein